MDTVVLDPGHGGEDTGATGLSGVFEKNLNLDVALRVQDALTGLPGIRAVMTRTADRELTLAERVQIAVDTGATVLVSVHHNSFSDPAASGTEVLYQPRWDVNRRLANAVYARLEPLPTRGRGVVPRTDLYILNRAAERSIPSCLVEVAFLTNPDDEALVLDEAFRQRAASGIASGITDFLGETPPRRGGLLPLALSAGILAAGYWYWRSQVFPRVGP